MNFIRWIQKKIRKKSKNLKLNKVDRVKNRVRLTVGQLKERDATELQVNGNEKIGRKENKLYIYIYLKI